MGSKEASRAAGRQRQRACPSIPRGSDFVVLGYGELTRRQRQRLRRDFQRRVLPALTPMALDAGHPFPRAAAHRSLNLAVMLKGSGQGERLGSLTVPRMFRRLWRIPGKPGSRQFIRLEELVAANIDAVFPGLEIVDASPFTLTCGAVTGAGGKGAWNRPSPTRPGRDRIRADPALRLEVERSMPRRTRDLLIRNLGIQPGQAIVVDGPVLKA